MSHRQNEPKTELEYLHEMTHTMEVYRNTLLYIAVILTVWLTLQIWGL